MISERDLLADDEQRALPQATRARLRRELHAIANESPLSRPSRWLPAAAACLVAAAVGGTVVWSSGAAESSGQDPVISAQPSESDGLPDIATSSWKRGDPSLLALLRGPLHVTRDGRCLILANLSADPSLIVWPARWTVRRTPEGGIGVVDASGRVVATVGERISFGGGVTVPRDNPCGLTSAVAVQSEVTRVPAARGPLVPELAPTPQRPPRGVLPNLPSCSPQDLAHCIRPAAGES